MLEVVGKLSESDSQLVKLQTSLDQMLQNKVITTVQYRMLIETMNSILILYFYKGETQMVSMGTSLTCSLSHDQIHGRFTLTCKMIRFTMQASDSVGSSRGSSVMQLLAHLAAYFFFISFV